MTGIVLRPVLFLDVDGVLNSAKWFASQGPMSPTEVDPRAVRRVQRIIAKTGARIVLSSSWRGSTELEEKLRVAGVPIDDVTPRHRDRSRGYEIAAWLAAHPDVSNYAILDDDADAGDFAQSGRFIRCYWRSGMYGKHERAVLAALGYENGAGDQR